jgi:enoyl-CoA hydratase/carnithine racemase
MDYEGYKLIRFSRDAKIVTATVDAPPINIITLELYSELSRMSREVEADQDCLVFVLKSANPDFFLAHFDVGAILQMPTDQPVSREDALRNEYHDMCNRMSTMDKVTIAQIEGRVGGGGSEFSMGFDMRFGVLGKTKINQMEVPLGILPGGTGTQKLPRLIGRNRAIEIILAGVDITAEEAERWGYLNRALPANEIGQYVMNLARRIAKHGYFCLLPDMYYRIGTLRFDGPNNYGDDLFKVKQVQDGKWLVVWPREFAAPGARLLPP